RRAVTRGVSTEGYAVEHQPLSSTLSVNSTSGTAPIPASPRQDSVDVPTHEQQRPDSNAAHLGRPPASYAIFPADRRGDEPSHGGPDTDHDRRSRCTHSNTP